VVAGSDAATISTEPSATSGHYAAIRTWADEDNAQHIAVARSYLAGPFPERAAVLALTGRFVADFAEMMRQWADWAIVVAKDWPDDVRTPEPDSAAFEDIADRDSASRRARSCPHGKNAASAHGRVNRVAIARPRAEGSPSPGV
jgi:hypothetical protein